jgi:hypothetical protein
MMVQMCIRRVDNVPMPDGAHAVMRVKAVVGAGFGI